MRPGVVISHIFITAKKNHIFSSLLRVKEWIITLPGFLEAFDVFFRLEQEFLQEPLYP